MTSSSVPERAALGQKVLRPILANNQSTKGSNMAMGYCDLTRDDDPITNPAWSVYTLRAMAVSAPKSTERPVMREGIA